MQNVSERYLTVVMQHIATYHSKNDISRFTSQGFRASCATTMFENGASLEFIGRHGNWKSETVLNGYIRPSSAFRQNCAELIVGKGRVVCEDGEELEKVEEEVVVEEEGLEEEPESVWKAQKKTKEEVEEPETASEMRGLQFSNCNNVKVSLIVSGKKRKRE